MVSKMANVDVHAAGARPTLDTATCTQTAACACVGDLPATVTPILLRLLHAMFKVFRSSISVKLIVALTKDDSAV